MQGPGSHLGDITTDVPSTAQPVSARGWLSLPRGEGTSCARVCVIDRPALGASDAAAAWPLSFGHLNGEIWRRGRRGAGGTGSTQQVAGSDGEWQMVVRVSGGSKWHEWGMVARR